MYLYCAHSRGDHCYFSEDGALTVSLGAIWDTPQMGLGSWHLSALPLGTSIIYHSWKYLSRKTFHFLKLFFRLDKEFFTPCPSRLRPGRSPHGGRRSRHKPLRRTLPSQSQRNIRRCKSFFYPLSNFNLVLYHLCRGTALPGLWGTSQPLGTSIEYYILAKKAIGKMHKSTRPGNFFFKTHYYTFLMGLVHLFIISLGFPHFIHKLNI